MYYKYEDYQMFKLEKTNIFYNVLISYEFSNTIFEISGI